ncbi:acetolactate synthase [Dacryopinax primogenitus]|uniref:Acetolactate synthase n=1 Tax=Dacryopinax primogenitus (strain DJM 731) TaxID=1858805 RepID=M5FPY7_DACPD|nr:acetolactate synthase [Dacryopinax primogenitus]EJT97418.1 acetolactate synthase [Dacryopinax primogenitus]
MASRIARSSLSGTRRYLSTTARLRADSPTRAPRSIEDSTSALDYKSHMHHRRPPPLPAMDHPRQRTAEEAVTNILYNTPPPSTEPFKKHILECLVQNEPGVLSRVSGILAGRGFNIHSLVVCQTEIRDLSRMCIVLSGQDMVIEQARRQLEDLVPVWAVLNYTDTKKIERELLLAKVSILGPEYVEDQLLGGPSHEARRSLPAAEVNASEQHQIAQEDGSKPLLAKEASMARAFEASGKSAHRPSSASDDPGLPPALTPSQLLALKHTHMAAIQALSSQFGGKIVDVSENSVIVEMTGKASRVDAFLALIKPFGVLESTRTGVMVMPRTPIAALMDDDEAADVQGVDASMLPPG